MYKTIHIVFKNEDYYKWEEGRWDDYMLSGSTFIIKKNGFQVGFYNMDTIKSITIGE